MSYGLWFVVAVVLGLGFAFAAARVARGAANGDSERTGGAVMDWALATALAVALLSVGRWLLRHRTPAEYSGDESGLGVWIVIGISLIFLVRAFLASWSLLDRLAGEESPERKAREAHSAARADSKSSDGILGRRLALAEVLDTLIVALVLVFFIVKPFAVQAFWIPSGSMKDTLLISDRVVVNRFSYRFRPPRRGDIVVFKAPPAADVSGREFIKRLIGLPGDRIRIEGNALLQEGRVYVNGEPLEETYTRQPPQYVFPLVVSHHGEEYLTEMDYKTGPRSARGVDIPLRDGVPMIPPDVPFYLGNIENGELVVPDGYYFFLGDNRNESNDGHKWGLVPEENLVGRASFIFWPPRRIRALFPPY